MCCASIIPSEGSGTQSPNILPDHPIQSNPETGVGVSVSTYLSGSDKAHPLLTEVCPGARRQARPWLGTKVPSECGRCASPAYLAGSAPARRQGLGDRHSNTHSIRSSAGWPSQAAQAAGREVNNRARRRKLCWTGPAATSRQADKQQQLPPARRGNTRTLAHSHTNTRTNTPMIAGPGGTGYAAN